MVKLTIKLSFTYIEIESHSAMKISGTLPLNAIIVTKVQQVTCGVG